ncbi:hypothetical protein ABIB10_004732 [Bradyrhizobium sp. RT3b]
MPTSRQALREGTSGNAMASLSVTDSAGMKGRGSPVTGEIEVMRQPPLWPPRKVLNMAYGSVEPGRVQGLCHSGLRLRPPRKTEGL